MRRRDPAGVGTSTISYGGVAYSVPHTLPRSPPATIGALTSTTRSKTAPTPGKGSADDRPTTAVTDDFVDLLRQLRLAHMRRHAPDVLATAKARRWEPAEAVRAVARRGGRRPLSELSRHPPQARRVPHRKTFDTWDETTSSIPAPTQRSLCTLERIGNHENLVVCGPSGTGKSHLLEPLGHTTIDHGAHVMWLSARVPRRLVPPPPSR